MIFELDHANITTALQEYMDKRNILNGKDFTFLMKTSRKGEKTSRAIITTVDVVVAPAVIAPVVEAEISPQMELPFDDPKEVEEKTPFVFISAGELLAQDRAESEANIAALAAKATPFKKLFAA